MKRIVFLIVIVCTMCNISSGQTTEFTYQGSLSIGSPPAPTTGNYDFEFRLFSVDTGGSAIATLQRLNVVVLNGSFTVKLDFGAQFPGATRYLEIGVRGAGGSTFTALTPRQQVSTSPYSIRSLIATSADSATNAANAANAANATNATTATNALQLGGVAANQYVLTGDARLSDARSPLPGSSSYIQNTSSPQASSNFNISGNGTAAGTLSGNIINSATQFNIGGARMFSTGGSDTFGASSYSGVNSFIGDKAGLNTVPNPSPGNSLGKWNSFFGVGTGQTNVQGSDNSFFGALAGLVNTNSANSFFGSQAGIRTTDGGLNTFVGWQAGYRNVGGNTNTFIGVGADFSTDNPIGNGNTLLGVGTHINSGVSNGTAIGGRALVTQSNSLILGGINGGTDTNVGIGTTAPSQRFHVVGTSLFTGDVTVTGTLNATLPISGNYIQNTTSQQTSSNFNIGANGAIGGMLGIGTQTPTFPLSFGTAPGDKISLWPNGAASYGFGIQSSLLQIHTDISAADIGFGYGSSAAFTESMRIKGNGNVGIGTASPAGKLHIIVPGSGNPISALTLDVGTFGTPANAVNSYYFKVRDVGAGSTPAFLIRGDGNVGIGTATPSQRLTVAGDASVTGTISGNGSGLTNIGTNNLAADPNGPSTTNTVGNGVPFVIRYLTDGSSSTYVIYNHAAIPAPRNFLIIDVWSINTATNNGGNTIFWFLKNATNCGGSVFANVAYPSGASGQFGNVARAESCNLRLFNPNTDDLVICVVSNWRLEVNVLAMPMP